MTHMETPIVPHLEEMTVEEKWDRLHDFFTMDHAISYKTHKRMGTVHILTIPHVKWESRQWKLPGKRPVVYGLSRRRYDQT